MDFSDFGTVGKDARQDLRIGDSVDFVDTPQKKYVLLPGGDYQFAVVAADVEEFAGSAKLPACQCLKLTLDIDGGEAGQGRCYTRLYICRVESQLRRLAGFYKTCGFVEKTATRFSITADVLGAVGHAHFGIHEYNGKKSQQLAWFLC